MIDKAPIFQRDFDRIALLVDDRWNHSTRYYEFLSRHIPAACSEALDVGCGTGAFSRILAGRARHVTSLDLSPEMIRMARERSHEFSNIDFDVADILKLDFPTEHFDCIASIATLHHLPFAQTLSKLKNALKIGGVLLVLDLYEAKGLADAFMFAAAMPVNAGLRLIEQRRLRPPREVREAWAEHARHDSFKTIAEVREVCAALLPGASVRRHLLWRYSVVWKKPVV